MTRNAESFKFFTSGSGCFQHGGEPVSDCGCCVLLGGSAGVRRSFDKSRIGLLIHFRPCASLFKSYGPLRCGR